MSNDRDEMSKRGRIILNALLWGAILFMLLAWWAGWWGPAHAESAVKEVVCGDWREQELSFPEGVKPFAIYGRSCYCRDYDEDHRCGDEAIP